MSEKFKFEGEMTYGQMYNNLLPNIQQEDAAEYLEACIQYTMRVGNMDHAEAENVVRVNIGYIAGYFSTETAQRIHNMFKVAHPFLGSADNWDSMTAEAIVEKGVQLADELAPAQPATADAGAEDTLAGVDKVGILEKYLREGRLIDAIKAHRRFYGTDIGEAGKALKLMKYDMQLREDSQPSYSDLQAKLAAAEALADERLRELVVLEGERNRLRNALKELATNADRPDPAFRAVDVTSKAFANGVETGWYNAGKYAANALQASAHGKGEA